jgi:hypothetical protein
MTDGLEAPVRLILPSGAALLGLIVSGAAGAQTLQLPRVEVGGGGGFFGAIGEGLHLSPAAGSRLTFNLSRRDAIELAADTLFLESRSIYGRYFLQYKRATRGPSGSTAIRPFYTAGTGGYYTYRKVPERRDTRPDGSVVIHPAHSTGEVSPLNSITFGGGLERGLNRHASFRFEGSGFLALHDEGFLGFRVLAGVSVPIGGYRAAAIR